jgi:thiosulfate dehydrogenase
MRKKYFTGLVAVFILLIIIIVFFYLSNEKIKKPSAILPISQMEWTAPDTNLITQDEDGNMIRYGRELILHTSNYFGPGGTIAKMSNGMNCGNCHIDAGTKIWGNNFSMVASTYPIYRNRSGSLETVETRVNDCFERSLNGEHLENTSKEMKAIIAYLNWIGKDVPKSGVVQKSGTEKLPFPNRAADSTNGKFVYIAKCQTCHGENGEGKLSGNSKEYIYPPLWGVHSYNVGAGIYELSKFAGYIKDNMPFGTTYKNPQLTNDQAWDVAAYVNSKPRPYFKDLKKDWPDISTKPVDYPFGPYTDTFSEHQHKYGPYKPIVLAQKKMK